MAAAQTDPTTASTAREEDAEDFVRRFREAWSAPTAERLNALLHDDVRMIQPMEAEVNGLEAAGEMWDSLFSLIPDISGEVLSWAGRGDLVIIELRMGGTFGGRELEWVTADRIRLEDGKVRERVAYFDPLPLIGAIATRPSGLAAWIRAKVAQRRAR